MTLQKQEQINSKVSKNKALIKIGAEITEIENNKSEKINKIKS
jgi:hypothetical protein